MKRYRNGEIWDFEHEVAVATNHPVILGLDGGTTSTVGICMPIMPFSGALPDPLPILARAVPAAPIITALAVTPFLSPSF
ncbi:hypothetical protein F3Y22_tig00110691pilonHSYRG00017 [Hibiscus syriacus]|uniref:Uncharacterized protein n=1 Tax=Hibiscus syriacus TaxID=106335 RepID=A0A6A2ZWE6_HIBSY|nr:hypothetical protein F3Y22_tig00110691pilonHSYRG00017 [Hibiscus syriacus]